jgi:hypothetical protein
MLSVEDFLSRSFFSRMIRESSKWNLDPPRTSPVRAYFAYSEFFGNRVHYVCIDSELEVC